MVGNDTKPSEQDVNAMPAYAVAHMSQVTMGPAIVEYLERIDATLAPFGGRFLVHGGRVEVVEGAWPGHLIVIEFADQARTDAWYHSAAYQEIVALRTDNSRSDVIIAEGVGSDHRATDVLSARA
jgi:uncharacterized protein (DUF1330 family)